MQSPFVVSCTPLRFSGYGLDSRMHLVSRDRDKTNAKKEKRPMYLNIELMNLIRKTASFPTKISMEIYSENSNGFCAQIHRELYATAASQYLEIAFKCSICSNCKKQFHLSANNHKTMIFFPGKCMLRYLCLIRTTKKLYTIKQRRIKHGKNI